MERRQLGIVIAGAAAVLLFILTIVLPLRRDVQALHRKMPDLTQDAEVMSKLAEEYHQLEADDATLQRWLRSRQPEFALIPYVTQIARNQGLKLASLQPSSRTLGGDWELEIVEVSIQDVSLSALVKFLYALTKPDNVVQIDRFNMRGDARKISVTFQAQTLVRAE